MLSVGPETLVLLPYMRDVHLNRPGRATEIRARASLVAHKGPAVLLDMRDSFGDEPTYLDYSRRYGELPRTSQFVRYPDVYSAHGIALSAYYFARRSSGRNCLQ